MLPPGLMPFRKIAKDKGLRYMQLYFAAKRGRVGVGGRVVYLEHWKTLQGWATTQEALDRFEAELNQWPVSQE